MTDIERQLLLNQIAILEALGSFAKNGQGSTQELLRKRYHESANLVRQHSNQEPR